MFFFALIAFTGCAALSGDNTIETPAAHHTPGPQPASRLSTGSYYYYSEAYLMRKQGRLDEAIQLMSAAVNADPDTLFLQVELASFYAMKKDPESALTVLDKVLSKDPEHLSALKLFARLKMTRKQNDQAIAAYEKIIRIDDDINESALLLGSLYLEGKQYDKALEVYTTLANRHPDAYAAYFFMGKAHALKGNTSAAETAYLRTLELAPDIDEPKHELAKIYKQTDDVEKLAELYHRILDDDATNVEVTAELGLLYLRMQQPEESQKVFADLGKRSDEDNDLVRKIIQLYLNQKKVDQGITVLKGMLKGSPESAFIHYVLGVTFSEKDDIENALFHLKKVHADSEYHDKTIVHMALLLHKKGDITEAIDLLNQAIKSAPDNPDIYLYLGWFYEDDEKLEDARQAISDGLEIDGDNVKLLFRLGVILDKLGLKDQSISSMKSVIELDPENANALNYLGYTYADMGKNLDEAEKLVKAALAIKPDDGYITDSLGWIYYQKGEYERALATMEKAVTLVPDDPVILEHLGDIYMKLNNTQKALLFYRKSLQYQKKDDTQIRRKIKAAGGTDKE